MGWIVFGFGFFVVVCIWFNFVFYFFKVFFVGVFLGLVLGLVFLFYINLNFKFG